MIFRMDSGGILPAENGSIEIIHSEKNLKNQTRILTFILTLPFLEGLKLTIPFIYRNWSG